jgi:two-component system, LuxR family, response regulator FixJ
MAALTVFLVDDNESFRRSTLWLLEDADMTVNEFPSAHALLEALARLSKPVECGCIVTDLRMPGMSGLELMEELRKRKVTLPVIMITGHGDVPLAVEAMRRGAVNFLEKPFEETVLIETIRAAVSEPGAALRNPEASRAKLKRLSPRERQVLELVCAGSLNKSIADTLGISVKTVELHRSNMLSKLETRTIQELVKLSLGYE